MASCGMSHLFWLADSCTRGQGAATENGLLMQSQSLSQVPLQVTAELTGLHAARVGADRAGRRVQNRASSQWNCAEMMRNRTRTASWICGRVRRRTGTPTRRPKCLGGMEVTMTALQLDLGGHVDSFPPFSMSTLLWRSEFIT